ncbi:MAG TPA: hypothetical protein VES42_08630 [Pilimelia sp.]|nr:hypothetical protein [Pilimelia sp.]
MAYRTTRGMSAPPEVVFSTATDPSRVEGWVPAPLRQRADEHRVTVLPERLRVEWRPTGQAGGWSGSLQVAEGDAGGAQVEITVDGDGTVASGEPVDELVDDALTELDRAVADNLTAG